MWERFRNTFRAPNITFLHYWGLISSIPADWRANIGLGGSVDTQNPNQLFYYKAIRSPSVSQLVYRRLVSKVVNTPTALLKWQATFADLSAANWEAIFKCPWVSIREPKLLFFQFKFLHRILPTNRLLSLMGKTDSDLCTFCQSEVETIDHLFWGCPFASTFILDVEQKFFDKQFVLSKKDIFFGFYYDLCHPYNFLIMHL